MGCGDNLGAKIALGAVSGGAGAIAPGANTVLDSVLGTGGGGGGDPLVDEALHTLRAYATVAPEQLKVMNEFNPQFADSYGRTLAATYAGTLPTYENLISPALARVNSAQRSADIADVGRYGAASRDAILASNPDTARLLAKLNSDANAGLDAGTQLTPDEIRQMQQASRAASSARGMSGSNSAVADELLRQYQLGVQRQQQRQAFAGGVVGLNQQVVGDPFMQILGRSGASAAQASQLFGQGQAQVSQSGAGNLYDPFKDAFSQMFHAQDIAAAKDAATKQMTGAIVGGALSGAGSIGTAMI